MRIFLTVFVVVGLFSTLNVGLCEPPARILNLRNEYVRLRNNDASGDSLAHRASWNSLAGKIVSLVNSEGINPDTAGLRLLGADTYLRLYRQSRDRKLLAAAQEILNPIINSERALPSDIGADAQLLLGDARICAGEQASARAAYKRALELNSQSAERAMQRLRGLDNGTYKRFLPSTDREVPRVVRRSPKVMGGAKTRIVVLDPGHGGGDRGAVSPIGGEEKEITLDISRRVKAILERKHGLSVRMTRDDDRFVPLARRTAYANSRQGDVFVSLHVNASVGHDLSGLEAYYLDNTDDKASRALAERENGVAPGAGLDDVSFMLSDLIQSGKLEDSILLTRSIEGQIRSQVISPGSGMRSLGVKRAPFFVLVGAHMPCSLIELFFVDHPGDGAKLRSDSFRSALAGSIADGIFRFVSNR